MSEKSNGTFSNVVWRFGERITAQLVSTIVSLVLARILVPDDYAIVAIVTILITVFNAFVTGGLGTSLIQKKDADEVDFSTIFYFSLFLSAIIYIALFSISEIIAQYYDAPILSPIIKVMGLRIPIAAVNSVQQAYIARKMQFKRFFVATLLGTVVSAVVGITLALKGFGPWALVAQYLVNVVIDTIVLFIVGGWHPQLLFSFQRLKSLLRFGLRMMGISVLDAVFNEIRSAIISIKYSKNDLAMYDNGKKYPNVLVTNINTSIGNVIFPVLSRNQDDKDQIRAIMHKAITISSYCLIPLLIGFAAVGNRFVSVILTDKWIECVPYIYITCIMCIFYPLHTVNIQAINAIGKSRLSLILEIIKKVINISVLLATMSWGTIWVALGAMIVSIISTFINGFFAKKLFGYSILKQMLDVLPYMLVSCAMGAVIVLFDLFVKLPGIFMLFIEIILGIAIYLGISIAFKFEPFLFLFNKAKTMWQQLKTKEKND